jgi:serine/threonine-protein kinase
VIRLGIQYLFAKNSLRLLLLLPALAILWNIAANPNRTVVQLVTQSSVYSYGALVSSAALSLKYRRTLIGWLDRKFFREACAQEQVLWDLIEQVKLADSIPEILTLVGTQVTAGLHPTTVHVCCRRPSLNPSAPAFSSFGNFGEFGGVEKEKLLQLLSTSRSTIEIIPGRSNLPQDAAELLEQLGARLVVPVKDSQQRSIGVILLGEKKSEEPYTASNQNLLKAIAAEMGVALELLWLRERVDNEQKMKENVLALLDREELNLVRECPQCGACYDNAADRCPSDGSSLTSSLLVQRVIDGKYRLDQRIGQGGYGAVYEGWDLGLKRSVAIKVVTSGLLAHKSAMRRFEREAQAAARLNHPNIIAIHDYGLARPDGAYLAMELVRGSTWRAELRRLRAVAPALAAEWFDQLFEGVAAAHQEGIIHRDLKPENVLIATDGLGRTLIKILDFGLAKMRLLDLNDPDSLTLAGTVVGTLGYMSPEQFTGGEVDERTDIFSLGVMAVEALTGRRPFRGRTPAQLLKSLLEDPLRLKAEGHEGKKLERVLRRCLERNAAVRYRSVQELRRDLIPILRACRSFAIEPEKQEHTPTITIRS